MVEISNPNTEQQSVQHRVVQRREKDPAAKVLKNTDIPTVTVRDKNIKIIVPIDIRQFNIDRACIRKYSPFNRIHLLSAEPPTPIVVPNAHTVVIPVCDNHIKIAVTVEIP